MTAALCAPEPELPRKHGNPLQNRTRPKPASKSCLCTRVHTLTHTSLYRQSIARKTPISPPQKKFHTARTGPIDTTRHQHAARRAVICMGPRYIPTPPPQGGSHSPEGGASATPRPGEGGWTPTRPARERPRESPEISRGSKVPRVTPQSQRAEGREDAEPAEQRGRRKLIPPLDRGHTARQCKT